MEEALATHQFEIYYQPKYSLMTEKPVGRRSADPLASPQEGEC
jgi:EAL domain-containing protein (putative c-di-GMP-specific phosphodiesterase class I)